MSTNQLIIRNLKKNIKNYSLYSFALIFTVALYFGFVTLQYDPAMDAAKGSIKGGAALRSASILLVAIVGVFLLYANSIFIKRRSKEIGLFQLIGMTKQEIFRILSMENIILYFSSVIIGIFVGFSFSKLITLILFKVTAVESVATLRFSTQAFIQTVIVFSTIYLVIMAMNFHFIRKQSILSLFRVKSSSEEKVKKISVVEVLIGILGLTLIISGYYISSKLFGGDFKSMNALFLAMVFILGSVIVGTYLFYKGSVRFIANVMRKKKQGYLNINEVLSLSSIMFRMKSNAMLLTIITTVSALAIGLLSLCYISYYSAEQMAINYVPDDFSFTIEKDAEQFKQKLTEQNIDYEESHIPVLQANVNVKNIMTTKLEGQNTDPNSMQMPVVSDKHIDGIDVSSDEAIFTGYNDLLQSFMSLKDSGEIAIVGHKGVINQQYLGLEKNYPISWYFTSGGLPTAIVDESTFQQLEKDLVQDIQKESNLYIGISLKSKNDIQAAEDIFKEMGYHESSVHDSQLNLSNSQKKQMGLIMFIVGFLGLTFLITSGCILYFKQMDESEEEKPNYTILRKLGFSQTDLLKGIQVKQVYNFGIPLIIGLLHSYFAVQSGWFLFGTEVWTPMLIVMGLYTVFYSIFAVLSVMYDKNVIKSAL